MVSARLAPLRLGASVNRFDVSVYAIRRRPGRRRPFEVRWRAAGRSRSKSFITRKLADSYRAELVRAARMGLDFDPLTSEPAAWNLPEPATVTWYQEATEYAAMNWPSLAAHSRASVAEALATVTPVLVRPDARQRPDPRELRMVLYQHAFNPARPADPGSPAAQILDWAQQASLPVGCLSDPAVLRTALEALSLRLDGTRAAANTIIRKRAVLHGALGYAAETGLLPDNPLDTIAWQVPQSSAALNPAVVASPAQVSALLDVIARNQPELTAFFGCLYYAALRPEEAVALRLADCDLPGSGWGMLRLAAATPRTAAAWTSDGTGYEQRGLKHRPDGTIRLVPAPPVLAAMLRAHHTVYGTTPDGRLFRGARGGPLSESVYGRAWHAARTLALSPELPAPSPSAPS
jgi:integrase